jgi:hypothetical protein
VISFDPVRNIWWYSTSHEHISLFIDFYLAKCFGEIIADVVSGGKGG